MDSQQGQPAQWPPPSGQQSTWYPSNQGWGSPQYPTHGQQQPYPHQPYPPSPKRRRSRLWLILAIVGGSFVFLCIACTALAAALPKPKDTTIATSAPTVAQQATVVALVPTPTPKPQTTSSPAILGGDFGAFVAKYGQPNDHSTPSGGLYHFQRYSGSNLDFLIVQTDAADGGVYAQRAEGVTAQAPDAGWNQQEASVACAAFLPRDAVYKRQVGLTNGYDKIYFSASVAKLFPESAFTDASNNQVQAGLFDVQYLYKSGTTIDSCDILIGTEQTQ